MTLCVPLDNLRCPVFQTATITVLFKPQQTKNNILAYRTLFSICATMGYHRALHFCTTAKITSNQSRCKSDKNTKIHTCIFSNASSQTYNRSQWRIQVVQWEPVDPLSTANQGYLDTLIARNQRIFIIGPILFSI